ncbi:hypothetical protein HUO13_29500 [Saccharopolyspora erythraea]|nr:hypothetical protein HUO13_29500 [Saccharopolyspora erythraea]
MRLSLSILLAAGLTSGCASLLPDAPDAEAEYANLAEVARAGDATRSLVPAWIPPQAENIVVKHDAHERIMRFRLAGGMLPADVCKPVAAPQPPALDATWWFDDLPQGKALLCGADSVAVAEQGNVFVWTVTAP